MAALSAVAEPEIPPKNMLATMLAWASPPVSQPTRACEKSTMRRPMPPRLTTSPKMMNSGTASSG